MGDDVLDRIDIRGRAAGAAVSAAASTRVLRSPTPPAPRIARVRPALLLATAIAVLGGLVWVNHRPPEPADGRDPKDLRYLIGSPPDGWQPEQAKDASTQLTTQRINLTLTTYGTHDDPTAPTIVLGWSDPAGEGIHQTRDASQLMGLSDLRDVDANGRNAGCGSMGPATSCIVETDQGGVSLTATGVPAATIDAVLAAIEVTDGAAVILAAAVPPGLTPLGSRPLDDATYMVLDLGFRHTSWVDYYDRHDDTPARLTVGWADESELAFYAGYGIWERVTVAGVDGYLTTEQNVQRLLWKRDGRVFGLQVPTFPVVDPIALAESVRGATDDEWTAIPLRADETDPPSTEGTQLNTSETGLEGEAPDGTMPAVTLADSTTVHDLAVTQTVESVSADSVELSVELPDGNFGSVPIAVVAGEALVLTPGGGGFTTWVDREPMVAMQPFADDSEGTRGVFVVATDPSATQLWVTRANGVRYLLDLVVMPGHPEVKVAALLLPFGGFVSAAVVDSEGTALATV
ncbi:MAG: hypothetical protein WCC60_23675 [Ilumatobacteraceae bacterium]